jgi:hypothetical protein
LDLHFVPFIVSSRGHSYIPRVTHALDPLAGGCPLPAFGRLWRRRGGSNGSVNVGTGGTTLDAPGQLAVAESGPGQITLTWVRPAGSFTGYNLEARLGSDPYQQLNTDLLPSNYIGLILTFSDTALDGTTYSFRMRAVRGTVLSDYSNEVAYFRPPNTPGQPTASYAPASGAVTLAWNRNTTGSDGLMVERTVSNASGSVAGPWLSLTIPDPSAATFVDTTAQAGNYYLYRVTNLKGGRSGQPSVPSNLVFTGLVPVSLVSAVFDSTQGGVQVTWASSPPSTADGILLERSDCDANSTSLGNWAALSLPVGYRTSYMDQTVLEGGRYTYRATNLYGASATAPCQMLNSVAIPLLSPLNLQVVATVGGLQLTWQNRSQVANQVLVRRSTQNGSLSVDAAILSPTTSSYIDTPAHLGYYSYTVVAKNGSMESANISVVGVTPNPVTSLVLTPTPLTVQLADDASLSPSGTWAFGMFYPFGVLSNNDPWPALFPATAQVRLDVSGVPLVDQKGWPHAVYATAPASYPSPTDLMHVWFDGSTWQSERMASEAVGGTSNTPGWIAQLDSTGSPCVIVNRATANHPYGGATSCLSYVHKINGTWTVEPLDGLLSPAVDFIRSYHFTLDGADTPHILIGNGSSVIDYVPTSPGAWASTTLPMGAVQADLYDFLASKWMNGRNGFVFFQNNVPMGNSLFVLQMKDGVWLPATLLEPGAFGHFPTSARCALSPDRSRIAVLEETDLGFKVLHYTPDGWRETLIGSSWSWSYGPMRIGFDRNQKVHVLLSDSKTYTDFHE